jgi:phage FluMu protein gp41
MSKNTVIKTLRKPWKVGNREVTEIELREPTVNDFIEAEKEANPHVGPFAYKAALAAQTMVRAGDYTGPFTPGQFKSMPAASWRAVELALMEAEALGEDEPPSQAPSA